MFFDPLNESGVAPKWDDYTLVMSAISVGNIGQLAVDLVLNNLRPTPKRVGRIFHPALEAAVGPDPWSNEDDAVLTACEVYECEAQKMIFVQFHSFILKRQEASFIEAFLEWIKDKEFSHVVCIGSIFDFDRLDEQLEGPPFRYLATTAASDQPGRLEELKRMGWKELERRQFPAPAKYGIVEPVAPEDLKLHTPGGGIIKALFNKCEETNVPFVVMLMFASEGYNVPEAVALFKSFNQAYKVISDLSAVPEEEDYKIPATWEPLMYSSAPPNIY